MYRYLEKSQLNTLKKVFSIYVMSLPITQYYKSPVSGFNLATFSAIVFFLVFAVKTQMRITHDRRSLPVQILIVFVTVSMLTAAAVHHTPFSEMRIVNYLRAMLLFCSILLLGKKYFDRGYALRALEVLLIASVAFMVFQNFMNIVFHHPIKGNISFLLTNESYGVSGNRRLRPAGFYMEPAAYAQSAMLYLAYSIFRKTKKTKYTLLKNMAVILGVILSGSGQGYAFLVILFSILIFYHTFFCATTKKGLISGIALTIVLVVGAIIIMSSSYGQYVLSRIVNEEADGFSMFGGSALSGRTYTNWHFFILDLKTQIFGVGFGRIATVTGQYYVNSLFYWLIECGYVSIPILILIALIAFFRGNLGTRVFIIIYAIMFTFSGCGRPMMICHYFMFLLYDNYFSIADYSLGCDTAQIDDHMT